MTCKTRWINYIYYWRCSASALSRTRNVHTSQIVHHYDNNSNQDINISSVFHNRNPRNNELLGFAKKRLGWQYQSPRTDYYNKLIFEKFKGNTTGRIEHWSGRTVVSASTTEWAIQKHLYSCTDVAAAENIGHVLARRCLQFGITHVFYDEQPEDKHSQSLQVFLQSLQDGQLCLQEPEEINPEYKPGIEYDKPNRLGEKKVWTDDIQVS